jgi:hypothetical protein
MWATGGKRDAADAEAKADDAEPDAEGDVEAPASGPTFAGRVAALEVDDAALAAAAVPALGLAAVAASLLAGWTPAPGPGAAAAGKLTLEEYYRRREEGV